MTYRDPTRDVRDGSAVAVGNAMSFTHALERASADVAAMPTLELTVPQAGRLWGLGVDDCRHLLDALVDAGVLMWTARRTLVRSDRGASRAYVAVRDFSASNRSVVSR
jgi:hypothetical protein